MNEFYDAVGIKINTGDYVLCTSTRHKGLYFGRVDGFTEARVKINIGFNRLERSYELIVLSDSQLKSLHDAGMTGLGSLIDNFIHSQYTKK